MKRSAYGLLTLALIVVALAVTLFSLERWQRTVRRGFHTVSLRAGREGAAERTFFRVAMADPASVVLFGSSELAQGGHANIPFNALPKRMHEGSVVSIGHAGMQSLAMASQIATAPQGATVVTLIGPGWFLTPLATANYLEHVSPTTLANIVGEWDSLPTSFRRRTVDFLRGHCESMQWKSGIYRSLCHDVQTRTAPSFGTTMTALDKRTRGALDAYGGLVQASLGLSPGSRLGRLTAEVEAASASESSASKQSAPSHSTAATNDDCPTNLFTDPERLSAVERHDAAQVERSKGNDFLVVDTYFERFLKGKWSLPAKLVIPAPEAEEFKDYLALLDVLQARSSRSLVFLSSFNAAVYGNMAEWMRLRARLENEARSRGIAFADSWDAVYRPSHFVDPQHISESSWLALDEAILRFRSLAGGC